MGVRKEEYEKGRCQTLGTKPVKELIAFNSTTEVVEAERRLLKEKIEEAVVKNTNGQEWSNNSMGKEKMII